MTTAIEGRSGPGSVLPIVLVSYHFHPSAEIGGRRATALARHLGASGFRVFVVSTFGSAAVSAGEEIFPGVFAIPVAPSKGRMLQGLVALKRRLGRSNKGATELPEALGGPRQQPALSFAGRLRTAFFRTLYFIDGSKSWSLAASRTAQRAAVQFGATLVLATAPPPSVILAGARAARRLGIPFIADLRDPWSDQLESEHPDRTVELRLIRRLERRVMRAATAVTSTGADVLSLLTARDPVLSEKAHLVRNGFDSAPQPPKRMTGNRLDMLFAGELYVGRDPFPLLAAIDGLLAAHQSARSAVSVTFMGRASTYRGVDIKEWARGRPCEAVLRLMPPQDAEGVARGVAAATLLINLAQGQHLSIPAKTFEQLASGREVLVLCEDGCETARMVAGIPGVTQIDPGDPIRLTSYLEDLFHRHVVEGVATVPSPDDVYRFSRSFANEQFVRLIRRALNAAALD